MSDPVPPAAARLRWNAALAAILMVGAAVRIAWMGLPGWERDVYWFEMWAATAAEHGVAHVADHVWCDYPPLFLHVLHALGVVHRFVHGSVTEASPHLPLYVKTPGVVADLATAWILAVHLGGPRRRRRGLVAGALVALNPAIAFDSAWWGQADAVSTLFALACVLLAVAGRAGAAGVLGGLAVLTKPQMVIFLAPAAAALAARDGRRAPLRFAGGALATALLVCLPFFAAGRMPSVIDPYLTSVGRYPFASLNAHNLWWIATAADGMGVGDASWVLPGLTQRRAGLLLFGGAFLLAMVHVVRTARHAPRRLVVVLPLVCGGIALAFYGLVTQMHERYVFPALVFLAVPAAVAAPVRALHAVLSAATLTTLAGTLFTYWPEQAPAAWERIEPAYPAITLLLAGWNLGLLALLVRPWIAGSPRTAVAAAAGIAAAAAAAVAGAGRPVALSSLAPLFVAQEWKQPRMDRSVDGHDLCIQGVPFRRGVGAHAPSAIRFHLGGRHATFVAHVGVQYQHNVGTNECSFEVWASDGDGTERLVGWSGVLRGVVPPVTLRCDVRGARELLLVTREGADGRDHDHTVWADARLLP